LRYVLCWDITQRVVAVGILTLVAQHTELGFDLISYLPTMKCWFCINWV